MIKLGFCMGQNADYFNNANQHYSFFYLKLFIVLLFNKRLEFDFFLNSIQIPTCKSQVTR